MECGTSRLLHRSSVLTVLWESSSSFEGHQDVGWKESSKKGRNNARFTSSCQTLCTSLLHKTWWYRLASCVWLWSFSLFKAAQSISRLIKTSKDREETKIETLGVAEGSFRENDCLVTTTHTFLTFSYGPYAWLIFALFFFSSDFCQKNNYHDWYDRGLISTRPTNI